MPEKYTAPQLRPSNTYINSWRDLSDADLARYLTSYRRAVVLLDEEVADPEVRESTRAWLEMLIADATSEDERRERAAELGVPRDAQTFPPAFIADLKANIHLDEMLIFEFGAQLGKANRAGIRRGPCPICKASESSTCFVVSTADRENQWWYCFRCLAGGDAIDVIVEAYRDSFPDAVRRLAAFGRIALPEPPTQAAAPAKRASAQGRRLVPLRGSGKP